MSSTLLRISARVVGERGEMNVFNPVMPHLYNRLTLKTPTGKSVERVTGRPTYELQLRAFAAAVTTGAPVITTPTDSISNMRVIDRIYQAAGLAPRGT